MSIGYTTYHLADRAMDHMVSRLIEKYEIDESCCWYLPEGLKQHLALLNDDAILYVVSHGANDTPLMMGGQNGRMTPTQFAKLLFDALKSRHERISTQPKLQVKLGMCFGAADIDRKYIERTTMRVQSTTDNFASMATNKLFQIQDQETQMRRADLGLTSVFIGGAEGLVEWYDDSRRAKMVVKTENVPGTVGFTRIAPPQREARTYYNTGHLRGRDKVVDSDLLPSKQAKDIGNLLPVYCWFPFKYEYVQPLRRRDTGE